MTHWIRSGLLLTVAMLSLNPDRVQAVGLLLVKGANPSPEFAQVVRVVDVEKFARNYNVRVPGGGRRVFAIEDLFALIEYDPAILGRDMVLPEDFAEVSAIVARSLSLQQKYPALKAELPSFLKPLQDVLQNQGRGLVQLRGHWMARAEYDQMLAETKSKDEEARRQIQMEEEARNKEALRKRDEARAAASAAMNLKQEAEKQAQAQEAERRLVQAREATLAKQHQDLLDRNLVKYGMSPASAALKSEMEGKMKFHLHCPAGAKGALSAKFFPDNSTELPDHFGADYKVEGRTSAADRSAVLLVSNEAGLAGYLAAFEIPIDQAGAFVVGGDLKKVAKTANEADPELAGLMPRALAACLASLRMTGQVSCAAPLKGRDSAGYLRLTKPALSDDGTYHTVLLLGIGLFPDGS